MFKVGDRVICSKNLKWDEPFVGRYYPPVGTLGTVIASRVSDCLVRWDNGTKKGNLWITNSRIELATEYRRNPDEEIDKLLCSINEVLNV